MVILSRRRTVHWKLGMTGDKDATVLMLIGRGERSDLQYINGNRIRRGLSIDLARSRLNKWQEGKRRI
jgi:hypothetical protein